MVRERNVRGRKGTLPLIKISIAYPYNKIILKNEWKWIVFIGQC